MTIEQFDAVHQARPFRPFTMCLADGDKVRVEHPEFALRSQSGRTIIVADGEESHRIIDLLLVTNIAVGNGNGRSKRSA